MTSMACLMMILALCLDTAESTGKVCNRCKPTRSRPHMFFFLALVINTVLVSNAHL